MMDFSPALLVDGLMWYLVLLVSTSAHEAAHAFAALRGGDPTASLGGQVSLNPVPHIRRSPIGLVVVPIISFLAAGGSWMMGWASAPFDPFWAARHPKRAALMSLAGPAANFAIAALAFLLLKIGLAAGWFSVPRSVNFASIVEAEGSLRGVGKFLSIALMLNVLLGVFNLIPLPPLDGHAVVPLFLSRSGADRWNHAMRSIGFMGIIIAWYLMDLVFSPIFEFVLALLYPGTSWH